MPDSRRQVLTPVIVPVTLVLGVALVGTLAADLPALAPVVLAVAGALLVYAWPRLLSLPSPNGVRGVLVIGLVACVGGAALGEGRDLRLLPVALAITLVAAFLHQLLRRDGRPRLVETLGGTMLGVGLIASGACFVGLREASDGRWLALTVVLAVVVGALADRVLHTGAFADWALPVALGVSSAIGAAIALGEGESVPIYFALALAAGVVSHAVRQLLGGVPTAGRQSAQLAIAAAGLLSVGVLPYAAAWLIER